MGEIKNLIDRRQNLNESLMTQSEKNKALEEWSDSSNHIKGSESEANRLGNELFYVDNNSYSQEKIITESEYYNNEESEYYNNENYNQTENYNYQEQVGNNQDDYSSLNIRENDNKTNNNLYTGKTREKEDLQNKIEGADNNKKIKERQNKEDIETKQTDKDVNDKFNKRNKKLKETSKVTESSEKLDRVNKKDSKLNEQNSLKKLRGKDRKKTTKKKSPIKKRPSVFKSVFKVGTATKGIGAVASTDDDGSGIVKGLFSATSSVVTLIISAAAVLLTIPGIIVVVILIVAGDEAVEDKTDTANTNSSDSVLQREVETYLYLLDVFDGNDIAVCGIMGNLSVESGGTFNGNQLEDSFQNAWGVTDEEYTEGVDRDRYVGATYFMMYGKGKDEDTIHKFSHDHTTDHHQESATMGAGYGISQFTYYNKKEDIFNLSRTLNCSVGDLKMQLYYMFGTKDSSYIEELGKNCDVANDEFKAKMATLTNINDLETAVGVMGCWEAHGGYSNKAYNQYGNDVYMYDTRLIAAKAIYQQLGDGKVYNINTHQNTSTDLGTLMAGTNVINKARGVLGVLGTAYSQIGYHEKKTNDQLEDFTANAGENNYTKYGRDRGCNGQPWCACFVSWCFEQSENTDALEGLDFAGSGNAAITFKNWGNSHNAIVSVAEAQAGDLFYRKSSDDHTGFVVANNNDGTLQILDGNGGDAQVSISTWSPSSGYWSDYCIIRPNYPMSIQYSYIGLKTEVGGETADNIWYEAWLNDTDFLGYYITGEEGQSGIAVRIMDGNKNIQNEGKIEANPGSKVTLYNCGVWNGSSYDAPTNPTTGKSAALANSDAQLNSRKGYYYKKTMYTVDEDTWNSFTVGNIPTIRINTSH